MPAAAGCEQQQPMCSSGMQPPQEAVDAAPPPQPRRVLLLNTAATPAPVAAACLAKPCKAPLDADLARLLASGRLEASCVWSHVVPAAPPSAAATAPLPLTVLHTLAGDAGPDARLLPDPSDSAGFEQMHAADLAAARCLVVRCSRRDRELVLVPLRVKTGAAHSPVYWAFSVPANLLTLFARVLHAAKLITVFDIDETLLIANTVESLQQRLRRLQEARERHAQLVEAASNSSPDRLKHMEAALAVLDHEQEVMRRDIEVLSLFREDEQSAVRLSGDGAAAPQVHMPSWESCTNSYGVEVTRPVVRLELGGRPVILTRVNPDARSTSLLIRPRPGWTSLRDYMSGVDDLRTTGVKKDRWEVYVCTTAEREYAWEAWQLLDPEGTLFPLAELPWRLLCVTSPQKKDLLNVLRKRDIDAVTAAGHVAQRPSDLQYIDDGEREARPLLTRPPPLAVVIDDRLEVWDEVLPFHPHREAAVMELGAECVPGALYQATADSEAELARVGATLKDMRSKVYQALDRDIKPEVQHLVSVGMSEQLQQSAAGILRDVLVPVPSTRQLLAESLYPVPASLLAMEREARASELGNGTSAAAAEAEAPGAAAAPGARVSAACGGAECGEGGEQLAGEGSAAADGSAAGAAAAAAGQGRQGVQAAAPAEEGQQVTAKKQHKGHTTSDKTALAGLLQQVPQDQQETPHQHQQGVAAAGDAPGPSNKRSAVEAAADDAQPGMGKRPRSTEPPAAAPQQHAPGTGADQGRGTPLVVMQQQQQLVGPFTQAFAAPAPPAHVQSLLRQFAGSAPLSSAEAAARLTHLLPPALRGAAPAKHVWQVLSTVLVTSSQGASAQAAVARLLLQLPEEQRAYMGKVVAELQHNEAVKHFMAPIANRREVVVPAGSAAAAAAGEVPPAAAGPRKGPQLMVGALTTARATPPPPPLPPSAAAAAGTAAAGGKGDAKVFDFRSLTARPDTPPPPGAAGAAAAAAAAAPPGQPAVQQPQQPAWAPLVNAGGQGGQLGFGLQPPASGAMAMQHQQQQLVPIPGLTGLQPAGVILAAPQPQQVQQLMFAVSGPPSGPGLAGMQLAGMSPGPIFVLQQQQCVPQQQQQQQLMPVHHHQPLLLQQQPNGLVLGPPPLLVGQPLPPMQQQQPAMHPPHQQQQQQQAPWPPPPPSRLGGGPAAGRPRHRQRR